MSVRRLDPNQPSSFEFSNENLTWAKATIAKYPEGKQASAVIPLLWRAQEQHEGWLPEPAMRYIAEMLDMAYIRVYEIATFYTMFQLSPVGKKAHIQVCGTTPCMLRGAEQLRDICKQRISEKPFTVSEDGNFSWEEVECLGVCVNAPMVQIWKDTYEDLTPERFEALLDAFANDAPPKPGPQNGRTFSAPEGGATTLLDLSSAASTTINSIAGTATLEQPVTSQSATNENAISVSDGMRPKALVGPQNGVPDDLKKISGVGPKLEGILNELGIYHYSQIASWNADNIAWVDEHLKFKGRIERENWIEQAKTLAQGGETEFSSRYGTDSKEDI